MEVARPHRPAGLLRRGGADAARASRSRRRRPSPSWSPSNAAMDNARDATQIFGGYGFMNEYPGGAASTATPRSWRSARAPARSSACSSPGTGRGGLIGYVDSSIHQRDHAEVGRRRRCRTPRHVRRCRRVVGRAGAGRPVGLHALLEEPQARGPGARNGRAPGPGHRGIDGVAAGAAIFADHPPAHIPPVDEPEVYIDLLITAREFTGRGVGAFLLTEARAEARRRGRCLVRVDCWAAVRSARALLPRSRVHADRDVRGRRLARSGVGGPTVPRGDRGGSMSGGMEAIGHFRDRVSRLPALLP